MADRFDHYLAQLVSESELDASNDALEQADWDMMADFGLTGIASGLTAVEHNPTADLTIDVAAGTAYDANGQRIRINSTQVVDMSVDHNSVSTAVGSGGNSKVVSLFVYADRTLSDPRTDGNSNTVQYSRAETFAFKVVQGSEATTGTETPPALESDKILICDVTLDNAQTQIVNADINANAVGGNRRQDAFVLSAGALDVRAGQPESAAQGVLTEINNHITGASNLHPASSIDYAGGAAWHDGETNPAATVEAQLDKIISDLAGTSGSDRIGGAAHTAAGAALIDLSAGSIQDQLRTLADDAASISGAQVVAGAWDFSASSIKLSNAGADLEFTGGATYQNIIFRGASNASIRSDTEIRITTEAGANRVVFDMANEQVLFDDLLDRAQFATDIVCDADGGNAIGDNVADTANRFKRRFSRLHTSEMRNGINWGEQGEDTLADYPWVLTRGVGTPSYSVSNAEGSQLRINTSSASADAGMVLLGANGSLRRGCHIEMILSVETAITNTVVEAGLIQTAGGGAESIVDATHGIAVAFSTEAGDTNWTLVGNANTTVTRDASTTAPVVATDIRVNIDCNGDGSADMYINGALAASLTSGAVGAGLYIPYFYCETRTTAVRAMECKYLYVWYTP